MKTSPLLEEPSVGVGRATLGPPEPLCHVGVCLSEEESTPQQVRV